MKRLGPLALLLWLGLAPVRGADQATLTFYLQLVCGSDHATPPTPDAKAVGQALSRRLGAVFKWKHYWELKRRCVHLQQGGTARIVLSREREAELALLGPQTIAVRLYYRDKLFRSSELPVENEFSVAGGDTTNGESWFVVVRRDQPPAD